MALSFTGKLFRRIALACGAWTDTPHKVWESHLERKYNDEYESKTEYIHYRGEDNKWHFRCRPEDDRGYEFWKALRWLLDNGYIDIRETSRGVYYHGRRRSYLRFTYPDREIRLTEKGLAAAPAYLKKREE